MKIPVFISVRIDSSRLPAKCFLELSPDTSVLSFVVLRARHFGLRPIICTDDKSYADGLDQFIQKMNVEFIVGPKENKLKRWFLATEKYRIEKFHSVDPDDPFFCPDQISRSYELGSKKSIVYPSDYSDSGGATEGYTIFSEDIGFSKDQADDLDTSYIKPFIENIPMIECPNASYAKNQTRLTLDYLDDFIYLRKLAHLYDYSTPRAIVERYILKNQFLSNLYLNDSWKQRQIEEGKNNSNGKI